MFYWYNCKIAYYFAFVNSEISDERIKEIEKYFKINLTEVKELKSAEQEDCIVLPLIRASAGYGSYNSEQGQLAVSKNELIQIGYKKFETLTGVQIFNNSMFPTINDGDLKTGIKNL